MSNTQEMERIVLEALAELKLDYAIFSVFRPPDRDNWCINLAPPEEEIFEIRIDCEGAFTAKAKGDIKRQLRERLSERASN